MERIRRAPLTFGLIGVTLLFFLGQLGTEQLLGVDIVFFIGAKINAAIAAGELWRFLTPVFVHGGVVHFGVNMYSLYIIGPAVERFYGRWMMLGLYLCSGISGVLFSTAFTPQTSVGASGAIFGLLGALGAFLFVNRESFGRAGQMQLRQIVFVALLNLVFGLQPGIDNWGHLGGLLFGAWLGWSISPRFEILMDELGRRRLRPRSGAGWRALIMGAALLVLIVLFAGRRLAQGFP
jgi:rhomboid protease GluP